MKKLIFLFCAVLLCSGILLADISDYYEFIPGTATYTEITGTAATDAQGDDVMSSPIDIGFTFAYGDNNYTQIKICSNGYITLGTTPGSTLTNNLTSTSYCPVVAPLWDDLHTGRVADGTYPQTSSVQYLLQGTAPNRTFTVQYKYAYWRYNVSDSWVNFQVVLYENGNIDLVYGPNAGTSPGTATASIGINMLPGGSTNFYSVDPISVTVSNVTETNSIAAYIPNGTKYSFNVPVGLPNDLAATSVTGTTTPSVGAAFPYTVNVRNRGTNQQTNYTVKLMTGTTELASVAGPTIQPGVTVPVELNWTPTATGEFSITGKVVLTGDENPLNDESGPLTVSVFPQGTLMIIVGDGTSAQSYPFYTTYGYSRDAAIYTLADLGQPGLITGIMWDVAVQYGNVVPYRILMKNTTDTQLVAEPWTTTIADAQVCLEDTVTFNQVGWVYFPFTNPFVYAGDNLVVMVENNYGGAGTTSSQTFHYTSSTTASHHYMYADNTPPSTNGYVNASRPNVGISFNVGGMGSLNGTVSSGGIPIPDATVEIANTVFSMQTSDTGLYNFPFVPSGTYDVTCTKLGYLPQTQQAVITAGQATALNFVMVTAPNVNVTGHVVGSDAPTIGLSDATVNLTGVLEYTGTTNASGDFSIPGVLAGNTYDYAISRDGYQTATGSITIGTTDYNMGTITLSELTSPPVNVQATLNMAETQVDLSWQVPGAAGPGYFFDFEVDDGGWVPTSDWTNPLGDWQWGNNYNVANYTDIDTYTDAPPSAAHSGTGMWGTVLEGGYSNCGGWSYLRQSFDLSGMTNPVLNFWHYMDGYNTWDYGLILVNGTTVWGNSSSAEFMPWQQLNIDLSAYEGQSNVQISFEWYATTVVSYAGWYIDDLYIGPATNVPARQAVQTDITPFHNSIDRSLIGYKVWRLLQGQEGDQSVWTQLTPTTITDTTYVNTNWQSLPDGNYRWAVKSVYTGDVLSVPALSNMVMKRPNDLSALTVTGELNPSVGSASNYIVQIQNTGTHPQTAGSYTVKIVIGTTEVASVAGPAIGAGETLDVIVPWTPETSGSTTINGKVVLSTDTLPDNDVSDPFEVYVHPAGTQMVIIGDGTSSARYPLGSTYGYERDATIYTEDQFGGIIGRITGVQWDVAAQYGNTVPYRIYLKNTDDTSLIAQPWDNYIMDATLMVEGTHTFDTLGWNYFPFPDTSQFVYLGGNLMVLTETNYGGTGTTSTQTFHYTTGPTACHHYVYAENSPPTTNGYNNTYRPNIGLTFTSAGNEPQFNVSPSFWSFGQVLINTSRDKEFRVTNIGGGTTPLIINNISITGSPFFTLQNLPTFPLSLNSFQSTVFNLHYAPTAPGDQTATITITDNLARTYAYQVSRDGLTRTEHQVPVSATAVDVTIYALPYFQNFDVVTSPDLPVDWNSIYTAPGTVTTYTTSPYSSPNCVRIYNSTSTDGPYLLAPPLDVNIPVTASRVRFWAKGSTSYVLSVGITADPLDSNTYEQVSSFNLTSSWAEYVVGFQTYAGGGHFITFKHGNASTSQSIYIDDVMIEVIADNDLAALSLTGNESPSVGNPYTYTVAVKNWGSLSQNDYLVKLYDGNDVELASAAGVAVDPDMTVNVDIPWTPTVSGAMDIYGKVILDGDQNNLNDVTPVMSIFVHPAGTQMVTIGDGTSTQRYPLGSSYGYERDASLYFESDFNGVIGRITGVQWYASTQYGNEVPYKIYLKTTTATAMVTEPWDTTISDATLMVEGTHTFDQTGWIYFPFPDSSNFVYLGDNLVVMVETNYGGTGTTSSQYFRYTTGPTASHHYMYAENSPPTTNGYTNTSRPNIGISFSSVGTEPQFAISPISWDFGQTFMNMTYDKQFTIVNLGGGTQPLTINSITISGDPYFTLQNLPALPVSLSGFQTTTFEARYNPTTVGEHTATILITDNLARTHAISIGRDNTLRTEHPVALTAECIDPTIYTSPYVQNFDDVTAPVLPIDWSSYAVSPGYVVTYTTSPNSAPNCVRIYNSTSTDGPYLISPPIDTTLPVNTMRIKFWAKGSTSYQIAVGGMSDPTNPATYQQVTSFNLTSSWTEYVVGLQTYTGDGQFIVIKHGNASTSQSIYVDDVMIEVIPDNDIAAVSVTGNTTPSVGMPTIYSVNLFNEGTIAQADYTVKLFREGDIEIGSVPGPNINPGMTATAEISWVPSTQGQTYIYGKVELDGDQNNLNDQTPNLSVAVQAAGTMVVTVGDGTETAYYAPVNMYYKNSLYENIYFSNELNFIGLITGITFYNTFSTNLPGMPTKVWLGTTTQTDLSAGWITSGDMTLVFDGNVDYPSGDNLINITFPTPFLFLQDNLVMLVQRPMDTQYYSSADKFYCQTVGSNRARRIYGDTTTYDPATITGGTLTGQFPKTSLMVIPGGVGHLNGHVYGAGMTPLSGATVQIVGGGQTTTNAEGYYSIINIIAGTYDVTASRYGYIADTITVDIPEDSTVVQDFTLTQMPTVTVSGTICGSDAPTVGLDGASISLTGYENYDATANAQGEFTIPGVYANQTYTYYASALGYQVTTGTMNVGATNYDMGNIIVSEIAYTPRSVQAEENNEHTEVTVSWLAPDPNAVDVTESFEDDLFPPTDWTQVITNNGPANTAGVYPTWCRFGEVISGTTTVTPTDGDWQCGFWWDYNHQDEWLITPQFNCPQGAVLTFDTYAYYGSLNNDHYYVKVTNNDGTSWTVLWDASALTGGWNNYANPVQIDLSAYAGQQVKIAWHADDPNATSDGMWYNWFIDNVVVGNALDRIHFTAGDMTTRSGAGKESKARIMVTGQSMSRTPERDAYTSILKSADSESNSHNRSRERSLLGYMVWRLVQGQEQNETTWTLLTPNLITDLTLTDTGWISLAQGTYKWAVKAVYTNDIYSLAAFSNPITNQPTATGTLTGVVRNVSNLPILGATITAGGYTTTSAANGAYSMSIPAGTYSVTCTAPGYQSQTQENIVITEGQTTVCNFILPVSNSDVVEVSCTMLKGNYPNPFNPETIITYDVKGKAPVRIDIYNTKGQLITTLVNEMKSQGHHQVAWNGRDGQGKPVASGIYTYRMQAGDYKATRRMMLLK